MAYRDRNLQFAGTMVFVTLLEMILFRLDDLQNAIIQLNPKSELIPERVKAFREQQSELIRTLVKRYEAELFQESYLPEFQHEIMASVRRKKDASAKESQIIAQMMAKVASFTD